MAFCTHCGTSINVGAAFCPNCGAPQNAAPAPSAYAPQNAAPAPSGYAPQNVAPAPSGYAPQNVAPAPSGYAPQMGQLHCPSCKGINLSPVVESSVTGALSSTRGGMTATHVSNIHRNYWICGTCGTKFRNIQNLEEEIVRTEKNAKTSVVMAVISALLFLFLILMGEKIMLFLFLPFVITVGLFALVSFCLIFSYKNKAQKLKDEVAYLQYHCFN